jgi:hypothetical protein
MKECDMQDPEMNRRDFLKLIAGGVLSLGSAATAIAQILTASKPAATSQPARNQASFLGKSLVVEISSDRALNFGSFNRGIIQEMIMAGVTEITGAKSFQLALGKLFSPKDIIAFKFDNVHDSLIRTNVPLAEELLRLMIRNGFRADQIYFIGVQPNDSSLPPTLKVPFGWGREVDFGSGKDRMLAILDKVTALVNVGTLRADAIAGMSGCLKNITYGLIKHPARFYDNHCSPYIADIYALPAIKNKVRLNVLSALRVLARSEQLESQNPLIEKRTLFFSEDVVAIDSVGFEMLDGLCKQEKLPPLVTGTDFPLQLLTAHHKGLGVYHPDQIFLKKMEIF